ncbi:cold regulated protein [Trema orientale]|uniref:Cold regulated protein n=1 Tax=Trema orientale TaxID=63057 RepID=A0A2P5E938_TREOI|nr:cold regulated protein [Trema orientale]
MAEENLPMPSSSTDPDPTRCFGCELTLTDSDSSAITLNSSKDAWLHCHNAIQGKVTEWTDEKHRMYLDSLEASFVDEFYNSMHLGGWGMKKNPWKSYSSDQFVVLGDGCWKKIDYEKKEPLLDSTAESRSVMESSWICHFTSSKCRSVASPDPQGHVADRRNRIHSGGKLTCLHGSVRGLEPNSLCQKRRQDLVDGTAEVSDQNFMEDYSGVKSRCKSMVKRLRTSESDSSNSDQIVPLKKFHATDVSVVNDVSSRGDEQGRYELLSKHPENFVCPKSDSHYFLRGS